MRLRALVAVLALTGVLTLAGGGPAQAGDPVRCGGRVATIVGTEGRDVLRGTAGDDVIAALGGNDVVLGRGGDDTICGGGGRDIVNGGQGQDTCAGEVAVCESQVVGSAVFPFDIQADSQQLINGRSDNLVVVQFVPTFGTVNNALWVNVAFIGGGQFTGTPPSSDWSCTTVTTGLPRQATSGMACEYTGTTPANPDMLAYTLGVDLPRASGAIYLQYCGSGTKGDFTDDGCATGAPVYMPVVSSTT